MTTFSESSTSSEGYIPARAVVCNGLEVADDTFAELGVVQVG